MTVEDFEAGRVKAKLAYDTACAKALVAAGTYRSFRTEPDGKGFVVCMAHNSARSVKIEAKTAKKNAAAAVSDARIKSGHRFDAMLVERTRTAGTFSDAEKQRDPAYRAFRKCIDEEESVLEAAMKSTKAAIKIAREVQGPSDPGNQHAHCFLPGCELCTPLPIYFKSQFVVPRS